MPKPVSQVSNKLAKAAKPREPLWKGPEDDGPLGGVTQSLLSNWLCCKERFRIKYIDGLQPEWGFSKVLEFGNMFHLCEETSVNGGDWRKSLKEYAQSLCKQYQLQQEDIEKWYEILKRLFPVYEAFWSKHPDVKKQTPLMREQVFHVPYKLPSGRTIWLKGKFDGVDLVDAHSSDGFRYPKGVWLGETKTKGDIVQEEVVQRLSCDLQTMIYLIALHEEKRTARWPIQADRVPIIGVRYNIIRRPFSGGRGSIKLKEGKETKDEYYERFMTDYVNAEPEYWFMRFKSTVSQGDIERFKREVLHPTLEQLCDWYTWVITGDPWREGNALHSRLPFGVYNTIMETGGSDLDSYLRDGTTVGLTRVDSLFGELK